MCIYPLLLFRGVVHSCAVHSLCCLVPRPSYPTYHIIIMLVHMKLQNCHIPCSIYLYTVYSRWNVTVALYDSPWWSKQSLPKQTHASCGSILYSKSKHQIFTILQTNICAGSTLHVPAVHCTWLLNIAKSSNLSCGSFVFCGKHALKHGEIDYSSTLSIFHRWDFLSRNSLHLLM
jgi:hypothetical protein